MAVARTLDDPVIPIALHRMAPFGFAVEQAQPQRRRPWRANPKPRHAAMATGAMPDHQAASTNCRYSAA